MVNDSYYTKALHAFLALLITAMGGLLVQLYGNLNTSVSSLDSEFVAYTVRATEQSRGADEKLAQYMLLVEQRLAALTVRVDYLEGELKD